MDADALVRASEAEHEEAGRLLEESGLLDLWQAYGAVELAGSYRTNLMLGSDLDLFVVNPAVDTEIALDALTGFVRRGDFLRFGFIDSVRGMPGWADPLTYPQGYYVGMAREFHGREWKVETWLLASAPARPDWIEERMSEEGRRAILSLKQQKRARQLTASGYDICRAVLLDGARSADDLRAWLSAGNATRG